MMNCNKYNSQSQIAPHETVCVSRNLLVHGPIDGDLPEYVVVVLHVDVGHVGGVSEIVKSSRTRLGSCDLLARAQPQKQRECLAARGEPTLCLTLDLKRMRRR